MYANGKLWGALNTPINPNGGAHPSGFAWFIVNPNAREVVLQGCLGAAGNDFAYPAIHCAGCGVPGAGSTTLQPAAVASPPFHDATGTASRAWNADAAVQTSTPR